MKYQTNRKECQSNIDKFGNVCDRCGRKLKPFKTVDNAGNPSYWAGCMHGTKGEDSWGHFTRGVPKDTYKLAVKLVLEDDMYFGMKERNNSFDYAWANAVSRACDIISRVEYMKEGKPRYTKKELIAHWVPS